jgi:opacity protein-like surface antigen
MAESPCVAPLFHLAPHLPIIRPTGTAAPFRTRTPPRTNAGRFASSLVNPRKKQMKKIATGIAAAAAVFAFAGAADAQTMPTTPFSIEARGGLAFPTGDLADGADNGYDVGVNVGFGVTPNISLYAGYTYNSFGIDDDETGGEDADINLKGFNGGARLGVPMAMAGVAPYVKGGAVYYEPEFSVDGGSVSGDSELGYEVGAGVAIPLGMRGSITPEVRYTGVNFGDDDLGDIDMTFVTVDVGLRFRI